MVPRRTILRSGVSILGLGALSGTSTAATGGTCVFIYDDGHETDLTKTLPVHRDLDAPGCIACPSGYVDAEEDAYLDPDQIGPFLDAGWEVLSHMDYHRPVGQASLTRDVDEGDTEIHATNDLHGRFDGDPLEIVDDDGNAIRTSVGRETADETIPLADPAPTSVNAAANGRVRFPAAFLHEKLKKSKSELQELGATAESFIAPFGQYDDYAAQHVGQFYKSCGNAHVGGGVNPEVHPYWLARQQYAELSRSQLDAYAARAAENDALLVFGSHSWDADLTESDIRDAVAAARAHGLEITTLHDALVSYGAVSSSGSFPKRHTIEIRGSGPVTKFEFEVGGTVQPITDPEDTDVRRNNTVAGQVSTLDDAYEFTGQLKRFVVTEGDKADITVLVDGEEILGSSDEQKLLIEGSGPVTKFEFDVGGTVDPITDPEDTDTVYESRVVGQVSTLDDAYRITGGLESFVVTEGNAEDITVSLDGKQITVLESESEEHELLVEGTGPVTKFEFDVGGTVENAGTLEDTDTVYESRVEGQVSTLEDRYAFTGDLNSFVVTEGNAEDIVVSVDGTEITVLESEPEEHELLIEGSGPVTKFEFDVGGTVENAGTLEDTDTVYESRVEGQVSTLEDRYAFTGDLNSFVVTEGNAEDIVVSVDGTEISVTEQNSTRELLIEGSGPVTRFEFDVGGTVENAGTLEDTDTVYESRVEGQVSTQEDRYAFTGDLNSFVVTEGNAEDVVVSVDGSEIVVSER